MLLVCCVVAVAGWSDVDNILIMNIKISIMHTVNKCVPGACLYTKSEHDISNYVKNSHYSTRISL